MSFEDILYYRQRAEREAEMAERARHPNAARAHSVLAGYYRDILDSGTLLAFSAPKGRARRAG